MQVVYTPPPATGNNCVLQFAAVCCSMLQRVAVCCRAKFTHLENNKHLKQI